MEGPIEQYNLPKFRWAVGPLTSIEFEARQQGPHLLAIYYRNVHPKQEVAIEVNGSPAGTFRLPWEDQVKVTDGTSCGFPAPTRIFMDKTAKAAE